MFRADDGRKRVRRRVFDSSSSTSTSTARRKLLDTDAAAQQQQPSPLDGVLVCLTGLAAEEKDRLHRLVEQLGGKYSRDLDTSTTTHLIAQAPEGKKFEAAVNNSNTIHVVSPAWLEACHKTNSRVKEQQFSWIETKECDTAATTSDTIFSNTLNELLESNERNKLFSSCRFLLVGFDDQSDSKLKLSKLIRRRMGTIYWELNELITHLIVETDCADAWREAARVVSMHHPNGPMSVSPQWVVTSCKENCLQPTSDFPPRKTLKKQPPLLDTTKVTKKIESKKTAVSSELLRGCVFALMRLAPPSDGVDYDSSEMERKIMQHGGQMLSTKLVEALKADKARADQSTKQRKCFVVGWGGYEASHVAMSPLLSQVQRSNLCKVVPVSPVWLDTCITEEKLTTPSKRPLLFEPQSWPTRRLPDSLSLKPKGGGLKVAMTGFVGSERTGIIHLLQSIGATYTENMRSSNTHLICKESSGPKYDKAVEWGLHVVTIDWLFHVAQFGYGGSKGGGGDRLSKRNVGCEGQFSLPDKMLDSIADLPARLEKRRKMMNQSQETAAADNNDDDDGSQGSQEIPDSEPHTNV